MSCQFLQHNLAHIEPRWPKLARELEKAELPTQVELVVSGPVQTLVIDGIQICSRYDRQRDARLQASLVPQGSEVAYIYGLDAGDLIRELLARHELKSLNLIPMNMAADKATFSFFDHQDWLTDPRVNILNIETEKELQLPFSCAPAFLYLADDSSARLRDLIYLELSTPYIKQQHSARQTEVLLQLDENESFVQVDRDVADLFDTGATENIVIAAAGPTLSDQLDWMKKHRDSFRLIAVDAAVRTLITAELIPDCILSVDSQPVLFELFFDGLDLNRLSNTSLVYFPVVNRKILNAWPGERFTAYSNHPIFSVMSARYPRGELFSSGSVIHPAIDLARKMGARRIILVGADFSFTKGQSHVAGSRHQLDIKTHSSCWVLNGLGERVPSSPNYVGYLRDLERYLARNTQIDFLNTSQEGALIEGTTFFNGGTDTWK